MMRFYRYETYIGIFFFLLNVMSFLGASGLKVNAIQLFEVQEIHLIFWVVLLGRLDSTFKALKSKGCRVSTCVGEGRER